MQTEIEAKFPDIDTAETRAKLKRLGATLLHPERLMKRKNFDFPDGELKKITGWVRLRDEGDKITLCYKQIDSRTLHGAKEINLVVDDFGKMCDFLCAIGLQEKSYQETKREEWQYKGVEIVIDTWPWVPTFVELEGPNEQAIQKVAADLGLNWDSAIFGSVEPIYQMHYNFTDDEIDHWKALTFTPPPDWLLVKKRKL